MNFRSILIVCLATLGLAVAGWGQADGKIAFISHREGDADVWIMNGDGSDPVKLTEGRSCISPAWSPDGTKIAYISHTLDNGEINREIWVMDADGSNPQQVIDIPGRNWIFLSWSEDGSNIFYSVSEPEGEGDTFAVALDGSDPILVDGKEAPHFPASRSPDGTKEAIVVLLDEEGHARLYIRDADGPPFFPLPSEPWGIPLPDLPDQGTPLSGFLITFEYPTWSPSSMRMAFSSRNGLIWAVDIDGSNLVELTNGLGGRQPAWQPVSPSATATSVESQSWGRIKSLISH